MSQLIQLKQRIKAIGAIRKITQTMRLISMSSHSKLKKQSESIQHFRNEISPLLCGLTEQRQKSIDQHQPKFKTLYVLVSAEKGLCGNFQSTMQTFFQHTLTKQNLENSHVISIGKKTSAYLAQHDITPLHEFDKAMPNNLEKIAQNLYEKIIHIHKNYESVICLYSHPKTFFVQEPTKQVIVPIEQDPCDIRSEEPMQDYVWVQDRQSVTRCMFRILLKINILLILTNSMLSEQSARFLSMDNATQSAETLLKEMKLMFNKLRQAKITRELIELISSF